jgi:hypothetical protein
VGVEEIVTKEKSKGTPFWFGKSNCLKLLGRILERGGFIDF